MLKKLTSPSPAEIERTRAAHGMTQAQAAEACAAGLRTWLDWEHGTSRMHPVIWQWFARKLWESSNEENTRNRRTRDPRR